MLYSQNRTSPVELVVGRMLIRFSTTSKQSFLPQSHASVGPATWLPGSLWTNGVYFAVFTAASVESG